MEMILAEIYVLICTLFLAGKDATSYLLKDHNRPTNTLDLKRIERWHRDGVALNALIIMPIVYLAPHLSLIILYTILIRLAFFDLAFNKWSKLDINYLGSTAWADKQFAKIFGQRGALKKSIFFGIIILILNIIF